MFWFIVNSVVFSFNEFEFSLLLFNLFYVVGLVWFDVVWWLLCCSGTWCFCVEV